MNYLEVMAGIFLNCGENNEVQEMQWPYDPTIILRPFFKF